MQSNENITTQKSLMIGVADIQREYLPMLSLKRIRAIVNTYCHTIRVGNKILVERSHLEKFLLDQDREIIR
jgi:hypothetical protein